VPLSKRTSIGRLGGGLNRRGRVKTPSSEFEYRYHLFPRDMKPVHNFVDGGSRFQILKHSRNRRPGISKHPCTAALAGNALHGRGIVTN